MTIIIVVAILFVISFILALRSMKDLTLPQEVQKMLEYRRIRGTIVFLKHKVEHYKHH